MNPSYPNTPTPLGTGNDKNVSGITRATKMFVLLFIAVVGFSLFMSWLEFSDNSEWALPNGKQVSLYTADIEGDHIKNANPIDESDIARVSDSSIYIQRSALVADPSYIYIPEWKVKILKPSVENFSYAFNGKDKLYIWGNVEDDYQNEDAKVQGEITNVDGQIAPAAYLGMMIKSDFAKNRNTLSVFDIDEKDYLYYVESADLDKYYQGNVYYQTNLAHTLQELNEHFSDFNTYQKFE